MKVNAIKNILMGTTLLAAAAATHSCSCSNELVERSNEHKTFITGNMNISDIKQRQSAHDDLALNSIDMFDVNSDGVIDEAEATVFNATDVEKSPDGKGDIILKTNMKDGSSVVQCVSKNDWKNFKYVIDSKRVVDWANIRQIKENLKRTEELRDISLDEIMEDNITSPAIITMNYYNDIPCGFYSYKAETFEKNNQNQKLSIYTDLTGIYKEIFNYSDSSQILCEQLYRNPLNPNENTHNNYYERRTYYTKDFIIEKEEYYKNDTLIKTEQ